MDSRKRKLGRPASKRRVRPKPTRFVDEDESDQYDDDKAGRRNDDGEDSASASESGEEESNADAGSDVDEEEDDDGDEDAEASPEPAPPSPTENLTFGQILKKREKTAKGKKSAANGKPSSKTAAAAAGEGADNTAESPSSWKDRSGKPSKAAKPARAHKHAPAEMTSRFAVKRGRDWTSGDATIAGVTVKSSEARSRDPRFFLASMAEQPSRADELRAQRNYAFLDEYRDSEMSQMRDDMTRAERSAKAERKKKGGNANAAKAEAAEREAAALRRQLTSMEARKHDRAAKNKAQSVLDEHKKRERGLVREGKTPYFLKKSEQKKRLLVDKFAGMTDQQVDKAIERRRKKAQTRERREMPMPRSG